VQRRLAPGGARELLHSLELDSCHRRADDQHCQPADDQHCQPSAATVGDFDAE